MAVRIIADGSCDLSAEECSRLDIIKIPLQVFFGDECFVEGENTCRGILIMSSRCFSATNALWKGKT